MVSQKNPREIQRLNSKIEIEDIVSRVDFEIPWKKNPVNQKTKIEQKSKTEKTFVKQDKGIKNALKLF
jgi:3-phosphoglycerate kinase